MNEQAQEEGIEVAQDLLWRTLGHKIPRELIFSGGVRGPGRILRGGDP